MKMYAHYDQFDQEWRWKNFTAKELSCKCCGEYYHDPESLDLLQRSREISGKPYKINSAHRCVEHNKAVGGMPSSMHLKIAFDVSLKGHGKKPLLQALHDGGFTTFGMYASFIHTDIRDYKKWYGCAPSLWGKVYKEVVETDNDELQ